MGTTKGMWADDLSPDDRSTVAQAMGRLGELVSHLDLDHVELVATLVDPDIDAATVVGMLHEQRDGHREFIDTMQRISATLETLLAVLEGATLPE